MPSCFLYVRKSTEEDDRQAASIPAQLSELRALAAARGLVISRTFEESRSAKTSGRPVFGEMMREVDRHAVAGIICWKPDRLARNALDGGRVIDALDRKRIGEIVTPERTFKNTGEDKFMLNIDFGISKKYVDDLSSNVKRGNRAVLARGRWPGVVPIGYVKEPTADRVRGTGAARAVPDPERFPIVRELFRRYLTRTVSVRELYLAARDELGLRTRGSRRYAPRPMPLIAIYAMLRNPFYMGILRHGGEVYPGEHEPMVSREEFEEVQRLLSNDRAPRPKRHTFTYRGLLACGECERGVTAEQHVKPSGLRFVYYRCTRRWREPGVCPRPIVSETRVEAALADTFALLDVPERFVQWALAWVGDEESAAMAAADASRKAIENELAAKTAELERLLALCVRGALSEEEYLAAKTNALGEKAALEARLADPASDVQATYGRLREALQVAADASRTFREGDPEQRRQLVAAVCEKVELREGFVAVQLAAPYALLAGTNGHASSEGANPSTTSRKAPRTLARRAARASRASSRRPTLSPAGANRETATEKSLNKGESRADGAARTVSFSLWCTRVKDVRTYFANLSATQALDS